MCFQQQVYPNLWNFNIILVYMIEEGDITTQGCPYNLTH